MKFQTRLFLTAFFAGMLAWGVGAVRAQAGGPAPHAAGRILVKYRSGVAPRSDAGTSAAVRPESLAALDARFGVAGGRRLNAQRNLANASGATEVVTFDPALDPVAVAKAYAADPGVATAEPDFIYSLAGGDCTPSDTYSTAQAADFAAAGFPAAWCTQAGAAGVLVAVIDSGCDTGHEDFAGAISVSPAPYDFVLNSSTVTDDQGHGTRVCGLIGAVGGNSLGIAGAAYGATLLPLDVVDSDGSILNSNIVEAIDYAVASGAQVINMSFTSAAYSPLLAQAIAAAAGQAVLVAAAGNEGRNDVPRYPAGYPQVIGVAALADGGGCDRAVFSNYAGPNAPIAELAAPGETLFSTIPGDDYDGYFGSGTSFAAPLVSAAAALLRAQHPNESPAGIRLHLQVTADSCAEEFTTYGKLAADAAVDTTPLPELSIAAVTIDDSAGNHDGGWDYGETVTIGITLKNTGSDGSTITATLHEEGAGDPDVALGDPSGAWPDILAGASAAATDAYASATLSGSPDSHTVGLYLDLAAADGYTTQLHFTIQAENSYSTTTTTFTAPQTWTAGNTYDVKANSTFTEGLSIEAGTVVRVAPGVTLTVQGSAFEALGTAEEPILFTSLREPTELASKAGIGPHTVAVDMGAYPGRVRYVDAAAGSNATGNGSSGNPWASVAYALSQISDAAVGNRYAVIVAEGVYPGGGSALQMKSNVDLFGGFEAAGWTRDIFEHPTILDGGYLSRVVLGADAATIDGFVIRGGKASNYGAGILCSGNAPSIQNNFIIGNNTAATISFGNGGRGAGIGCIGSSPLIANNLIQGNSSVGMGALPGGGGIYLNGSASTVQANMVCGNVGAYGGGVFCDGVGSPLMAGNWVEGNALSSGGHGSGVYCAIGTTARFIGNTLVGNAASSGACFRVEGATSLPVVTNSIIWGNANAAFSFNSGGGVTVSNSAIQGGYAGTGNISSDPLFGGVLFRGVATAATYDAGRARTLITNAGIDLPEGSLAGFTLAIGASRYYVIRNTASEITVAGDATVSVALPAPWSVTDLHLRPDSPCKDAGVAVTGLPTTDIDGGPRTVGAAPDMGADEIDPAAESFAPWGRLTAASASVHLTHCVIERGLGLESQSASATYENCTFRNNGGNGLEYAGGTIAAITTCTALSNGGAGIAAETGSGGSPLTACEARFNTGDGLRGGNLSGCTAVGNGGIGMSGAAVTEGFADSNLLDGINATDGVTSSTASRNGGRGVYSTGGDLTATTGTLNTGIGLELSGGGTAHGCVATSNLGGGMTTGGSIISDCLIQENSVAGVTGSGNSSLSDSRILDNSGPGVSGVTTVADCAISGNGAGLSGVASIDHSYIVGNTGIGITGGAVSNSTIVANTGGGLLNAGPVSNSWVLSNGGIGIDSPTGNLTGVSVRGNAACGVKNLPAAFAASGCDLLDNGTCSPAANPEIDYFDAEGGSSGEATLKNLAGNYWGAATGILMQDPMPTRVNIPTIFDRFDSGLADGWFANYGTTTADVGEVPYDAPSGIAPAFISAVTPGSAEPVGVELATYEITFSEAMDTGTLPAVTFGLLAPYAEYVVEPDSGWVDDHTWRGRYAVNKLTGDGTNTLRIRGARTATGSVIPDDATRTFIIDTSGATVANAGTATTLGNHPFITWGDDGTAPPAGGLAPPPSLYFKEFDIRRRSYLQLAELPPNNCDDQGDFRSQCYCDLIQQEVAWVNANHGRIPSAACIAFVDYDVDLSKDNLTYFYQLVGYRAGGEIVYFPIICTGLSDPLATPTPGYCATTTPAPTNTPSPTPTPSPTRTRTPTPTATSTPTASPTRTATSTPTPTRTPSPTPSASPTPMPMGRAAGDFDNSGCTDLADFLTLLDLWQLDLNGTPVTLADFLNLLDNWQLGATCPQGAAVEGASVESSRRAFGADRGSAP